MSRGAKFVLSVLVVLAIPITMCWRTHVFDEDWAYTARRDVQLVQDTPEVQQLFNDEGDNIAERAAYSSAVRVEDQIEFFQHPERHAPKHLEFLSAIPRNWRKRFPKERTPAP